MTNPKSRAEELAYRLDLVAMFLGDPRPRENALQAAVELRRLAAVEAERDRLAAELERVKSDQQSRFCPECEARGRAATQEAAKGGGK